ncbi:MAG: hypothetical protein ACAI35_00300 [Candidatus Methylacidiphilales bacterium]|nr:hypothetical protein [Candidatus Methylacidiphilales bacterium]
MMESDLYRRLVRWLFALCGVCFLMLMFFWMIGLRFQATPWDYHLARFNTGKTKATLMLNDSVGLYRTRSAVGMHLKDGTPVVAGVINSISYDDKDKQNTLWISFSTAAYPFGARQLGEVPDPSTTMVARINLARRKALLVDDPMGIKIGTLEPVETFFP